MNKKSYPHLFDFSFLSSIDINRIPLFVLKKDNYNNEENEIH
jgi:hypothetical protein